MTPHDNDARLASLRVQLLTKTAIENVTAALVAGIPVTGITFDKDIDIGDIHLLNIAEAKIDPSASQPTNSAFVAADPVTPAGAVRKDTEALPEAVADGDWTPLQTNATGELRITDDTLIAKVPSKASNVAAGAADLLAPAGIVRKDTRALPEAVADGDWVAAQATATGDVRVRDDDANTDLDTLITDAKISNVAAGAADRLAGAGAVRKDTAALPEAVADGDWVALQTDALGNLRVINGTSTDAPLAAEVAEDTTARTGISLWKRMVNKLIDIKALLVKGAAAMAGSISVTLATDDTNTTPFVTSGGGGYVRQDSTATMAKETGGNLAAIATSVGIGSSMTSVAVDLDANAAAQVLVAGVASTQIWVYGYELHANILGSYQFLSAAIAKTGIMPVGALGGVARDSAYPIFKCATAEALNIKSVACAADGIITYRVVAV